MQKIIHQIITNFTKKIIKRAYSEEIRDIDAMAADILEDCKRTARELVEQVISEINHQIREDKQGRKEQGLVLKEKNRPRTLLTKLGTLDLTRDYYYDQKKEKYVALLDEFIGLEKYEQIGKSVGAELVTLATEMSYGKSAEIVCGGKVSRQTVKNQIQKLGVVEKASDEKACRQVKELHLYADEDHVHLQKPGKEKGKKNIIVPLVSVTEGTRESQSGRNQTINPMYFVDKNQKSSDLWKSVEGYISKTYDIANLEKIYIHGDGGKWIKNGLESFRQSIYVMDGYHLEKRLKDMERLFPKGHLRKRLRKIIIENDVQNADEIIQQLSEKSKDKKTCKKIKDFYSWLTGNWEAIVNRMTLDVPGSCTEGQVSHILSERFSRDPMGWSQTGIGILSTQRVYLKNGGKITNKSFVSEEKHTYSEYTDTIMNEYISERAFDWSIFEPVKPVMDVSSPTQILISHYGKTYNRCLESVKYFV